MSHLRIHRYIVNEISVPALLGMVIFSFVLLLGRIPQLTELIINKGVPALDIVELFAYLLPTFFSVTVPLAFLLGILIAFGRMSADSEYIALKASGVSLWALIKPVAVLALLFSLLTAGNTMIVEPASKSAFRSKLFEIATGSISVSVKPGVFNDDFPGIVLYARGVDERRRVMQDVFISDERIATGEVIITAREGRIISDPRTEHLTLRLHEGDIHRQATGSGQDSYQTISFTTYDINLDFSQQLDDSQRRRSRSELSSAELWQQLSALPSGREKNRLQAEFHERIVIACAPLVLILIGIPLGLQSQRSGKGAGFALALVIFLIYYILLSFAGTLADEEIVPAAIILWLPNLVFVLTGGFFLYRTAIERPVTIHLLLWRRLLKGFNPKPPGGAQ